MLDLIDHILVGFGFVVMGAAIAFAQPSEAEAAVDPASLPWGRRPPVRRAMGLLVLIIGVLIIAARIASVTMR